MIKLLVAFLVFIISASAIEMNAQAKHDYVWLLGYSPNNPSNYFGGVMLDFNEIDVRPQFFNIGFWANDPSSFCSKDGRLLAYSNGCHIMGQNHEIIIEGDSIAYGYVWENYCEIGYPGTQNNLFLSSPGDSTKIILLHIKTEEDLVTTHLLSTMVEFSDHFPSGRVIEKDKLVLTLGASTLITAAKHGNGRDWWVLIPEHHTNNYFKILVNPEGAIYSGTQSIGEPWGNKAWGSQMIFSPDGTRLIRFNPEKGLDIMEFDRCSGQLSNIIESGPLTSPVEIYGGVAVSPNSRFVYVANRLVLYQYDLLASDIVGSRISIDTFDGYLNPFSTTFYHLMLAPDGEIYGFPGSASKSLHVIEYPDEMGLKCTFTQHSMELPVHINVGANNLPYYRLGPLDFSPCDSLDIDNLPVADFRYRIDSTNSSLVHFRNTSYFNPDQFEWTFGDQTYSSLESPPAHYYSSKQEFEVCLTVRNQFGENTLCRLINLNDSLTAVQKIEDHQIAVIPNPFSFELTVNINDRIKNASIHLYSSLGIKIAEYFLTDTNNEFDTSSLISGLYYYTVVEGGITLSSGVLINNN